MRGFKLMSGCSGAAQPFTMLDFHNEGNIFIDFKERDSHNLNKNHILIFALVRGLEKCPKHPIGVISPDTT